MAENPIKVRLRFVKSEKTGYVVGFVSQNPTTGIWHGVPEDKPYPKKICVLDRSLVPYVLLKKLYDVEMIPMRNKDGFVAKTADPVSYPAKIVCSHIPGMLYHVEAVFGGKRIVFDPSEQRDKSVCEIERAVEKLRMRTDVENLDQAVEEFANETYKMNQLYKKRK